MIYIILYRKLLFLSSIINIDDEKINSDKPLVITTTLTIKLISIAIKIILFVLAPAIIIIIGPNATLGNEFKQVKNGSNTLYNLLDK